MTETQIKVLIVDDTRTIRLQLKSILRSNGFAVSEAGNGAEAMDALNSQNPEVILMDVMMPDMDGIQCCKAIRQNPNYKNIRIIMVTGATEYERISEAYRAGCNDYITKPIDDQKLLKKIDKVVRLGRILRQTNPPLPGNFLA